MTSCNRTDLALVSTVGCLMRSFFLTLMDTSVVINKPVVTKLQWITPALKHQIDVTNLWFRMMPHRFSYIHKLSIFHHRPRRSTQVTVVCGNKKKSKHFKSLFYDLRSNHVSPKSPILFILIIWIKWTGIYFYRTFMRSEMGRLPPWLSTLCYLFRKC